MIMENWADYIQYKFLDETRNARNERAAAEDNTNKIVHNEEYLKQALAQQVSYSILFMSFLNISLFFTAPRQNKLKNFIRK